MKSSIRQKRVPVVVVGMVTVAAALLAGCADVRPLNVTVAVPSGYEQAGRSKPAEPVRAEWWRSFGSPELTSLVQQAQLGNLDIATAIANIEQAEAGITIAGAPLYPQLNGDISAQRARSASSTGRVGRGRATYGLSASASYEIDFCVGMDFKYKDYFEAAASTGYETLIYDCMIGDAMLFQRADGVEAGWAAVQPFLDAWANAGDRGLATYTAGSEGPAAAEVMLDRDGRSWRAIT